MSLEVHENSFPNDALYVLNKTRGSNVNDAIVGTAFIDREIVVSWLFQ